MEAIRGNSYAPRRIAAALALVLALALLAALGAPAERAWAYEGGTIEVGAVVANRVEAPESGDEGALELGVAVGYDKREQEGEFWGMDGWLEIGCAVGLDVIEPGTWGVTFHAGRGSFNGSETAEVRVPYGAPVGPRIPIPKRAGWRIAGWHLLGADAGADFDSEGVSAVPLGDEWDFSRVVEGDMELYARWELRLDVTVPIAVGVAINASTNEVLSPAGGLYAMKSRTVRPVAVEEVAVVSREAELRGALRLPEGTLPPSASATQETNAWTRALMQAWVSLAIDQNAVFPTEPSRDAYVRLGLAARLPESGEDGHVWVVSRSLSGKLRDSFTVPAFVYGSTPADDDWEGAERCERLSLDFDMGIKDALEARVDVDGPQPVTHLRITVAAQM